MTLHDRSIENIKGNLMMVSSEDHKVRLQISVVFVYLCHLISNKGHYSFENKSISRKYKSTCIPINVFAYTCSNYLIARCPNSFVTTDIA